MKTFIFPYYISFGKNDSVDCELEYSLSTKDAKRLERSSKEGGRFRLSEDDCISDLYDRILNEIIESDPDYNKGEMTYSLIRTLRLANLAEFNFGLSKEALRAMPNDELAVEFENFGNESLNVDIYDVKYCNESCMNYDVEDDLDKINSRVLIISCKQDPHFPPELDGIPMSAMIENSELIVMDSELGHLCFNELENMSDELLMFMHDCEG